MARDLLRCIADGKAVAIADIERLARQALAEHPIARRALAVLEADDASRLVRMIELAGALIVSQAGDAAELNLAEDPQTLPSPSPSAAF